MIDNMTETIVRTRFAPSPTGYLHIGGARTAIFSWLFAKHHGGQFILRIEDTDQERSTDDSIEQIIDALKWLNIDYDEGPYRQTERQDLYKGYIEKLLASDNAYRCVCSKETLDEKRKAQQKAGGKPKYDGTCRGKNIAEDIEEPYVIRFATPQTGETIVEDLLRGSVRFDNTELDDMIIARSDGSPTYNFVVVIDDAEMKISHVIRGDDHLANTPRQAVIYKALGFDLPKFAHVSMILGNDGSRLSKRHGALSVLEYRDRGILPEAFINYMVRLGWSHGDREVFSVEEMIELFSFDSVSKSAARFDEEKMTWINSETLRAMDDKHLAECVKPYLEGEGVSATVDEIAPLMPMLKPRSKTLVDLAKSSLFIFADSVEYEEKAAKKFLKPESLALLDELADRLENIDFGVEGNIEAALTALLKEKELKLKNLAQPVRVALTGGAVSPGLYEMMAALGKEVSIKRIRTATNWSGSKEK